MSDALDTDLPVHPFTGLEALAVIGGRPVWPVLGGAPDDEDGTDTGDEDVEDQDQDEDGTDGPAEEEAEDEDGDDAPLGPKGEKALKAEKERRRSEAKRRRKLEAELADLKSGGKADDPDQIRRQAEQAATAKANQRIIRAEMRAAAAGKLADPADALTFIDTDQFEVDEDGNIDVDEVADAISDLIKTKPYLAAATAKRFQGTGDGGARKGTGKPTQLTRSNLEQMSPQQIVKAKEEGRLNDLLGINR